MTIKYDILLDPVTGDMPLYPVLSNGPERVAQGCEIAVSTHVGEVLFDKTVGLPYFEWGQMKPFRIAEVSDFIRRVISKVDGVHSISEWSAEFNKTSRRATINGRVLTDDGSEFGVTVLPSGDGRVSNGPLTYFTITGIPKIYTQGIL